MKTKLTAIIIAAAILFSFAACGKTAADTTTSAATTIQTTIQAGSTTAAETTTEPATAQSQTDSRTGADTTAATTKATTQAATTTAPAVKAFTKSELAKFDGKNGNKAYVAYNGIVYNVTNSPTSNSWTNGEHHGLLAGTDLTSRLNNCFSHSDAFFASVWANRNYPQVGTYTG